MIARVAELLKGPQQVGQRTDSTPYPPSHLSTTPSTMASETTSTPWRDSGITSDTTASGPVDIDQEKLKAHLYLNLRGHTWQFPPHDIARMLSPKLVKEENRRDVTVRPQLDHYDILITHPVVENVMHEVFARPPPPPPFTAIDERANYTRTVDFLNSCIGLCNTAYNTIYERRAEISPFVIKPRSKRWLPHLRFVVNDKLAGDTVRGSVNPIKPDVIAIDSATLPNPSSALVGYWNLPDELRRNPKSNARQIQLSVDLKKGSWKRMVLQLATYGRGQYTASPLRVFTIVFGIDHSARTMRVLIFHHGGLTASHEINLGPRENLVQQRRDLLKIFLSILLWQGPGDAGLPEYTNGESWIVPSGKNGTVIVKQKAVLYYQPLLRSRETFVAILSNKQPPPDVPSPPVANETEKLERIVGSMTLRSLTKPTTPNQIPTGNSTPVEQPTNTHPTGKRSPLNGWKDLMVSVVHQMSKQYEGAIAFYDDVSTRDERDYGIFSPGDAIGKVAWPTLRRRGVEASMYRACNGDYGTPDFISAYEPLTSRGDVYSNAIYLPPPGSNLESYFWKFAEKDPHCTAATEVDVRNKAISFIKSIGDSLEYCVSAWDLCECLLHSMLGMST